MFDLGWEHLAAVVLIVGLLVWWVFIHKPKD